jgi:hypothetical protein
MQTEQNERLARGLVLLSPQLMDWAVTVCFYAALHLVDSYLARLGIYPRTHVEREGLVQRRLPYIRRNYLRLKHYSLHARYQGAHMKPATAFQPAFVENPLATELEAIRNYIAQLP